MEQKYPYVALAGVLLLFVALAVSASLIPSREVDAARMQTKERSQESEKYVGIRVVNLPTSATGFVVGSELGNTKYRPFDGSGFSSYYSTKVPALAETPLDPLGTFRAGRNSAHDLGYATGFTYPPDLSGTTLELLDDSFEMLARAGATAPMLSAAKKP